MHPVAADATAPTPPTEAASPRRRDAAETRRLLLGAALHRFATQGYAATTVREIADDMRARTDRGQVASYIPELANVDPARFGIALIDLEGNTHLGGDAEAPFSIQSISKVFTLTLALERLGEDLWKRVGREPSGSRFNSIVQLEHERGVPRNPFINAGAIVVTAIFQSVGMASLPLVYAIILCIIVAVVLIQTGIVKP